LTVRGYIGLAPAITQKGDSCAIIFGCTTPSILRLTNGTGSFQYLGATFIPGRQNDATSDGRHLFLQILGDADSKDWTQWDVEEQDIYLC
jgi:hypothetical protein